MRVLSLSEAEKLKDIIHPGDGYDESIERYRYLVEIRELYGKGFAICIPENILWENFREMFDDLTGGK